MTNYQSLVKRGERVVNRQINSLDNAQWKAVQAYGKVERLVRRAWSIITWQKP